MAGAKTLKSRLDLNFCLATFLGKEAGLTAAEWRRGLGRLERAHRVLEAERLAGLQAWRKLPADKALARRITDHASALARRFEAFVVVGIGGSALGSTMLQTALAHPFYNEDRRLRKGRPRVFVADNVDPALIGGLLDTLDLKKTCFNVITKSGATAETMATYLIIRDRLRRRVGRRWPEHIIATTDPSRGYLREAAEAEGYATYPIPPAVGGRFSVLSAVGLLPAAVAGIDITALLSGAGRAERALSAMPPRENPAYGFALACYLFDRLRGVRINVLMPYSQPLKDLADWFRQLWAESLGKAVDRRGKPVGVGLTPVRALGATDQHSQLQLYAEGPHDKLVCFVTVEEAGRNLKIPRAAGPLAGLSYLGGESLGGLLNAEARGTEAALAKAARPSMRLTIPRVDPDTVGELILFFEVATACAGALYNINPYDQPGVEASKRATYGLMGREGFAEEAEEVSRLEARKLPDYVL
ncbi:MAG: glucose-6-phosphate isomerase [bacterium]